MKKTIFHSITASLAIAGLFSAWTGAEAQTSVLYMTQNSSGNVPRVTLGYKSGQEVLNYTWASGGEHPIYVDAADQEIRQANWRTTRGSGIGHGYDLSGNPNGNTYTINLPANSGHQDVYDVGFDGENVYLVNFGGTGGVYIADKSYGNASFLFQTPSGEQGITFDTSSNTIWTANRYSNVITQWDLAGNALTSFQDTRKDEEDRPLSVFVALAYDPADDTIWVWNDGFGTFDQFDKQGNLLGSMFVSVWQISGAEFAIGTDCQTLLSQAEIELDTALDEILNLDVQIENLESQNVHLNDDLQVAQSDLLDTQNNLVLCQSELVLAQQNLSQAQNTIQDQVTQIGVLTTENGELLDENNTLQARLDEFEIPLQMLTDALAGRFKNPGFTIPGEKPAEQLTALVKAIIDLENGPQKRLYENLTQTSKKRKSKSKSKSASSSKKNNKQRKR